MKNRSKTSRHLFILTARWLTIELDRPRDEILHMGSWQRHCGRNKLREKGGRKRRLVVLQLPKRRGERWIPTTGELPDVERTDLVHLDWEDRVVESCANKHSEKALSEMVIFVLMKSLIMFLLKNQLLISFVFCHIKLIYIICLFHSMDLCILTLRVTRQIILKFRFWSCLAVYWVK